MASVLQIKGQSVLLVTVLVVLIGGSVALTCLDCENAASLRDCSRFTDCGPEQACYIEKYLNDRSFEIVHRAGCRNIRDCKLVECNKKIFGTTESTTRNPALSSVNHTLQTGLTTKHARFKRDLVVCTQCCYNDTCNTNGCGSSYYDVKETTLHCFSQEKVTTNETVQKVKLCQTNEVCSAQRKIFTGIYGYDLGCLSKAMCDILVGLGIAQPYLDTKCCDSPLCNVNPLSHTVNASSIAQLLACPTALVKTTTPTTLSPTTPTAYTSNTTLSTISTTHQTKAPTPPPTMHTPTPPPSSTTLPNTIFSTTRQSTSTTMMRTTKPSTTSTPMSTTQPPTSTSTMSTTQPSTTTTTMSITQPSTTTTTMSTTKPSTTTTTMSNTKPSTTTTTMSTTKPSTSTSTMRTIKPSTSSTTMSTTQPSTSTTTKSTTKPLISTTMVSTTQPTTSTTTISITNQSTNINTSQPFNFTTTVSGTQPLTSTSLGPLPAGVTVGANTPALPTVRTPVIATITSNMTANATAQPTFTAAANTTLVPQTTTLKDIITLPPTQTTRCYKCAGPPEACELAYYEDDCVAPDNYCINHVINKANGDKLVDRKCGNVQSCYKDWYLGSSDDDKCRQLADGKVLTYEFECTYCCTKDSCNLDLHPKQDTLYSPTK